MSEKGDESILEDLCTVQLDRFEQLKNELINFSKDGPARRSKHHFSVRLKRIDQTRAGFVATHQEILTIEGARNDDYVKESIFDQFEQHYVDIVARIQTEFERLFPVVVDNPPTQLPSAQSAPSNVTYQILPPTAPSFKLPQLNISPFSGVYTEWPQFHDSFLQIHNNDKLTTSQKFQYLKTLLSPKVKSLIGHLDITAENYDTAWTALIERFNNKRVLFGNYMEKFLNQPIMSNENADDLQTMHDVSQACVFAFEKLGVNTAACSVIFAHLLIKKLPHTIRLEWEKHLGKSVDIPIFDKLIEFIDIRFRTLEAIYPQSSKTDSKQPSPVTSQSKHSTLSSNKPQQRKEAKSFHISAKTISCPMCQQSHVLRKCPKFLQLSVFERKQFVDKIKYCINCLGHTTTQNCSSTKTCFNCGNRHHTLLHFNTNNAAPIQPNQQNATSSVNSSTDNNPTIASGNIQFASNNLINANSACVLLTTALIDIPDINGQPTRLRALIDQCSQHSVITERAAQRLKLPITPICVGIRPMGETQYKLVNKGLYVTIHSLTDSNFSVETIVAINSSISSSLPLFPLKQNTWAHIQSLPLADPHFASPGQIDILLGGEIYHKILQSGLCKGQDGEPMAQNTSLGWILSGEIANQNHVTAIQANCFHLSTVDIGNYIQKFYELEEVSDTRKLSMEDEWTVDHYNRTYQRQDNGKFIVRLPFKHLYDPNIHLGASYAMALNRFKSLHRRFQRDIKFHQAYVETFNEYKHLNQVKLVETINDNFQEPSSIKHFYLPHHAVIKENSLTTQLRQVFDGSAKSSNGNSLNDILTTGPSLQSDIITIIMNWRVNKFVIMADIAKMYRCIDVHPDDTPYQQLLWEENSQLQTYSLQTVTFGIKCSPFLAIQSLLKLADLERDKYPLAYTAITNETYVDDVVSGSDTIKQTIDLSNQLIQMLRGAGFELRKWASNSQEILEHIPSEYRESNTTCLLNSSDEIKALGLSWSPNEDHFQFNINFSMSHSNHTKRTVLSSITRLFDPLGWLNPFITKAKLFLAKLWEENLDWDQTLPPNLNIEWTEILQCFQFLNQITIPRWLHTTRDNVCNELHVFCDSSIKAYATAIYVRTIDSMDNVHVNLLIAKSKLAPVRHPLTIPRAELCGALLGVTLLTTIITNFQLEINKVYFWTDSSIVLSWIRGDPNRWGVFVSNRIHKILSSTEIDQWNHVVSKDNPADCNSRGLSITQLNNCNLWWHGPTWLSKPNSQWPFSPFNAIDDDPSELRSKYKSINVTFNEISHIDSILARFSNLNRLRHSFAYLLRYIQNLRDSTKSKKQKLANLHLSINEKIATISPPTVNELEKAEQAIVRWIQNEHFSFEFKALQKGKPIAHTSKLIRLNPFIDSNQILRVNGRLHNAFMSFNEKHPMILPANHRIAYLIVHFYHKLTLHGGPLLTVNQIRQNYWILNLRNFTRHFINKCVVCFKKKPIISKQLMGSLPLPRVNDQARPFSSTIVDYAGPYDVRASKGRGQSSYKGYVAVFTCMATKAVHLEAAGDCSTHTFLHAFERFVSRRGLCHDVYSDCGTNFVGASNDLKRSQKEFESTISEEILPFMNIQEIQWHFSPPGAPHFNGLAEAAVKSMKFHLSRIIGDSKLTFEEFSTVLTRIEAVLNSRPISPCSDDPNDLTAITPGHFLIGNTLLSRPQSINIDENPIKRHQLMQSMIQHFWTRFRNDILSAMQIRTKWQTQQPNLKENDLVIIKDERFPVGHWPMARVIELHKGKDDLVRVVSLKTSHGMLKRPISKLCVIPTPNEN